jgi:hypothetical protein
MYIFGYNAKLYTLPAATTRATWGTLSTSPTAGFYTGAHPTSLVTVTNVTDLKLSAEPSKAKTTTRANGGFTSTVPVLKTVTASWKMIYDPADPEFMVFYSSFVQGIPVQALVADSDITVAGALGFWATWGITKFDQAQDLEDVEQVDIEMEPTYCSVPPQWVISTG